MSVQRNKRETQLIKFIADVHQEILHLLVNIAANSWLFTELIKSWFDQIRLSCSSHIVSPLEFFDCGICIDIDHKGFHQVLLSVVYLYIDIVNALRNVYESV
jgi:hypothetical protein